MEVSWIAKSRITPEQKACRAQLGQLMDYAGIKPMEDIQALFKDMIAIFVNQGLESELDEEPGYSKYDLRNKDTDNSRNDHSEKTLITSYGDVDIRGDRRRHRRPHEGNLLAGCFGQRHQSYHQQNPPRSVDSTTRDPRSWRYCTTCFRTKLALDESINRRGVGVLVRYDPTCHVTISVNINTSMAQSHPWMERCLH